MYLMSSLQHRIEDDQSVSYDLEGYSLPARIILFAVSIFRSRSMLENVDEGKKSAVLEMLSVFAELATDHLSIASHPGLWSTDLEVENEMTNLLADVQLILSSSLTSLPYIDQQLSQHAEGMSVASYYNARAYATLMAQLTESSTTAIGTEQQQALESKLVDSKLTYSAIALMTSGVDLKLAIKLCNGYIDAIAQINVGSRQVEGNSTSIHRCFQLTYLSSSSTCPTQLSTLVSRRHCRKYSTASSCVPRKASVQSTTQR